MALRVLHYADVENAYDTPERVGRLAGAIDARRDAETIVTGGGDNTAPGVLSLVTEGRQSLEFFRAVEPDVDVFGNHDFDYGLDAARRLVRESPQAWLAANVELGGRRFAADDTVPHVLVERGGHSVGVVGVTTPHAPDINPEAADLSVTDPVPAVRESAAALRDRGAEFLVVVSHCGDGDDEIAAATDVDAVLGGHEHEAHMDRVDGTLVARPGSGGTHLLDVSFDGGRPTAERHPVADEPLHDGVAGALRDRMRETGLTDVVAAVPEPVRRDDRATRAGESAAGNFVTDALRWCADADVALQFGGVRGDDPLLGEVTAADVIGLSPFDNEVAVLELDGGRLRDALRELKIARRYDDAPERLFGTVSGVQLTWDDRDDTIVEARVGGDPLDDDATYEVAVRSYYVDADNIFRSFGPGDVARTAGPAYEALVAYAREHGIDHGTDGRVRRPYFDAEPEDTA